MRLEDIVPFDNPWDEDDSIPLAKDWVMQPYESDDEFCPLCEKTWSVCLCDVDASESL